MAELTTGSPRAVERALDWARRRPHRIRGYNPWELVAVTAHASGRHRLLGVSAEMAFFAVLALVPLTVAFGGALGYLGRVVGPERVVEGREAVIAAVVTLLGPDLTADAVAPFILGLLRQERGGLAISGLLLTFWLASRVFTPAMFALDSAYAVENRRSPIRQRLIGLALAVGSMVASCVTLVLMIAGPVLLGVGHVAEQLRVGRTVELAWAVGRWPVLLVILVGFLVCFYRYAPSHRPAWRECLPGAVVGVLLWLLVAAAFRIYLDTGMQPGTRVGGADETIVAVGRTMSAVVATMLWTFLSSLVILLGGQLNAGLARRSASRG
jgi:membrane protein